MFITYILNILVNQYKMVAILKSRILKILWFSTTKKKTLE